MNAKRMWQGIFGEFLIGDRVKIIARNWVYKNQIGRVSNMEVYEGKRYYLVRLPHEVVEDLDPKRKPREGDDVGYFRGDQLILVHGNAKSGSVFDGSGQIGFTIPQGKKIGKVV